MSKLQALEIENFIKNEKMVLIELEKIEEMLKDKSCEREKIAFRIAVLKEKLILSNKLFEAKK
jgi:hypothetical protein